MNEHEPDAPETLSEFEKKTRELFNASVDDLDAATLSRLNRGRQKALEELRPAGRLAAWLRWTPVAGAATAAVLVAVLWVGRPEGAADDGKLLPVVARDMQAPATDFEILLDEENLELDMLAELEFYAWVELDGNVG